MDSPAMSRLLRQLFSHETCSRVRLPSFGTLSASQRRCYRTTPRLAARDRGEEEPWQPRTNGFPKEMSKEFERYPMVTADSLRSRKERPRRVKMLARDFFEDSLYNPNYGYFSKQVVIFSPGEPFDFNSMRNDAEFHRQLSQRYTDFEDKLDAESYSDTRQLWHTPTELFRPYYGEAIARYLVSNYKFSHYPSHDLIIYEMGAGNGTLMLNVLDYIRDVDPEVYARTQFKIIEITPALASLQSSQLVASASSQGHSSHVEIINKSIFDWETYVPSPCYILALEVLDNLAHDCIRYDPLTEKPFQSTILIDSSGSFHEFYSPVVDPLAQNFLRYRSAACSPSSSSHFYSSNSTTYIPYPSPLRTPRLLRQLRSHLPFAPNLTPPEYIPTLLLPLFNILYNYFPHHRLLTSDFSALPTEVPGINAPLVQTRYQRRTVPVGTPFVNQGFFDILWPTDFAVAEALYRAVTGKLTKVMGQEDFLKSWAYVEDTRTKGGGNPMLEWYRNAKVMLGTS